MPTKNIRVLLIRSPEFSETNIDKTFFKNCKDILVAGEVKHDSELPNAYKQIIRNMFDIVLLELVFPGITGPEILKEIKKRKPQLPVLMFCFYPEKSYALKLIREGASGYFESDWEPKQILEAIRKVAKGENYISPTLVESIPDLLRKENRKKSHDSLTKRELGVFHLLASGKEVGEVAYEICLSPKTVYVHRKNLMKKLGLLNNIEIARYADKHNLKK